MVLISIIQHLFRWKTKTKYCTLIPHLMMTVWNTTKRTWLMHCFLNFNLKFLKLICVELFHFDHFVFSLYYPVDLVNTINLVCKHIILIKILRHYEVNTTQPFMLFNSFFFRYEFQVCPHILGILCSNAQNVLTVLNPYLSGMPSYKYILCSNLLKVLAGLNLYLSGMSSYTSITCIVSVYVPSVLTRLTFFREVF